MNLRPYQSEAIAAVEKYLRETKENPLVVIPTAGGKTIVFATMFRQWLTQWPGTRVGILAHVKELLTQAGDKLKKVWPEAPIGYWSAGLGQKNGKMPITIAGIQSIYRKAPDLDPFDILLVDEAHLIPTSGYGMYRQFLMEAKLQNPKLRVIGFTATPMRLDGGFIARPDDDEYLLDAVAYQAEIGDLIDDGYLCPLTSKSTASKLDTSGVKRRGGDFVPSDLARRCDTDQLVRAAVKEMVSRAGDRKSWLIFCCSIDHATHVRDVIREYGVSCETVHGKTDKRERENIIKAFDKGHIRAVTNVNVLTTGLDVTRIDMIGMLRPTQSTALYIQMVGRGFRLDPNKQDTLVLDFAGNVMRHGPVNDVEIIDQPVAKGEATEPKSKVCPTCEEIVTPGTRACAACGFEFPPPPPPKHDEKPSEVDIIAKESSLWRPVTGVKCHRHVSASSGKVTLRVCYIVNELSVYAEYVCLEHDGYARRKAEAWWAARMHSPAPKTVDEALGDMLLQPSLLEATEAIKVMRNGNHVEVIGHKLNDTRKARA